jgi:hypothetical protein
MYITNFGDLGKLQYSKGVEVFQQKLKARGFDPGPIDGKFGDKTRAALNAFRKTMYLGAATFPDMRDLEILGVPENYWVDIITQAGAPKEEIDLWVGVLEPEPAAPPAPTMVAEPELPAIAPTPGIPAEDMVIPAAAAAAAPADTKEWFKKNWPYLAVGGGLGVLLLGAAIVASRKKSAVPGVSGLGQAASKMKDVRPGKQLCAAIVKGADGGRIRCGTVGPDLQLEYRANGGVAFAPIGEAWDMSAWAIPVTKKEAKTLVSEGYARR